MDESEAPQIEVQNIDHLGIVAGIIDEIGLVEEIDHLLGTHSQEHVSAGQALKAMILNGLGFVSAPLYLFEQFFYGKATEHLIAPASGRSTSTMTDWGGFWTSSLRPTPARSSSTRPLELLGTSESAPKVCTWTPPLCTSTGTTLTTTRRRSLGLSASPTVIPATIGPSSSSLWLI